MYEIYTTYSRYLRGWFAQIWDRQSGKTAFTTATYHTQQAAREEAERWVSWRMASVEGGR